MAEDHGATVRKKGIVQRFWRGAGASCQGRASIAVVRNILHTIQMANLIKTPWHYLAWKPPKFAWQGERNLASLTRRRGWLWALLLFWGVVDGSSVRFGRLRVFVSYNYTGLLAGLLAGFAPVLGLDAGGSAVIATIGLGWLVTVVWGTARYVGWLAAILGRWPPTGRA